MTSIERTAYPQFKQPPASVTTLVHCRMISSVTELPEQDFTAQKETTRPSSQAHCPFQAYLVCPRTSPAGAPPGSPTPTPR